MIRRFKGAARAMAAVALITAVSGCVTTEEYNAKVKELEAKIAEVNKTATAAKVDAATALLIADDLEKKSK